MPGAEAHAVHDPRPPVVGSDRCDQQVKSERHREEGSGDGRGAEDGLLDAMSFQGVEKSEGEDQHEALPYEPRRESDQNREPPRRLELNGQDRSRDQGHAQRVRHPVLIFEPADRALSQTHQANDQSAHLRLEASGPQEQKDASQEGDEPDLRERVEGLVHRQTPGHQAAGQPRSGDPKRVRRILRLVRIRRHVDVVAVIGLHDLARTMDEAQFGGDIARVRGHDQSREDERRPDVSSAQRHAAPSLLHRNFARIQSGPSERRQVERSRRREAIYFAARLTFSMTRSAACLALPAV